MRLVIDGGGYAAAADAFVTGNQVIGLAAESLAGKVSGYAAMAGDDTSAHDFADAYDTTATTALTTLAELTGSFAGLAELMAASGWNHAVAEAGATLRDGAGHGGGPGATPALDTMSFTPPTLPSAAGGTPADLGNLKGWIVEHVQGFAWPTADTGALREAANTWRHVATAVDDLPDYCRTAADHLELQVSPEIPLALDVIADLKGLIKDTHTQVLALAQACDDYADQVETARELMHAVLDEILAMVVEGAVVSGLLATVSGGIAAAGGAAAISAKIATKAPKLHAITASLVTTAGATAATARTAGHTLAHTQTKLARYARAKANLRDERGSIGIGAAGGALGTVFKSVGKKGWLDAHEHHKKGHTLARHVGKTDEELMARFDRSRDLEFASTYVDKDTAERVVAEGIETNAPRVREWLRTVDPYEPLEIDHPVSSNVGRSLDRAGEIYAATNARIVLIKDDGMPDGFRVLTSFPSPRK